MTRPSRICSGSSQRRRNLKMVSLGKSAEGRDVWMVIASKERAFTPEALRRTSKPIVLAQGGIHAGEIDGKDAGLMLLRDMTVRGTKRELLDGANFLFVPIFNVDGHERFNRWFAHQPARPGGRRLADERAQPQSQSRLHEGRRRGDAGDDPRARHVAARPLHRPPRHRRRGLSVRHHLRLERRRGTTRRRSRAGSTRTIARPSTPGCARWDTSPARSSSPTIRSSRHRRTASPIRASRTATATRATSRRSSSRTTPSSRTTSASSARTSSSSTRCARSRASVAPLRAAIATERARRPESIPLTWKRSGGRPAAADRDPRHRVAQDALADHAATCASSGSASR